MLLLNGAIDKVKGAKNETKKTKAEIISLIAKIQSLNKLIIKTTDVSDKLIVSQRLLNTTLGDNSDKASEFVKQLSKMSGINEASLNTQVAKFSQLGESFGLASDQAENFSEKLSILSTKLALLYNTDVTTMSSKLSKALAGSKKQLQETTGIVASQINMQTILYENGIDRQVSSLNEGELAILRYAAITRQATSDMFVYEQAVNSLAWQKQMLTQQITRLSTALGQILTPILTKVYTLFNAIIIVITKLITVLGKLFGISMNVGKTVGGSGGISSSFEDLSDNISGAAKAASKSLRAFDKLNNITTPNDSGASGKGLSIDPRIGGILADANDQFLEIENNANKIAKSILEWLGFTEDENGELKFTKITFGGIVTAALSLLAVFKVLKGIFSALGLLKIFPDIISNIGTIIVKIGGIILIIQGIVDIINAIKDINENGWNFDNIIQLVRGIALVVSRNSFIIRWLGSSSNRRVSSY